MTKFKKIILRLLGLILLVVAVSLLVIWIKSPGTPVPIVDKNGTPLPNSISVIEQIPIGGIDQHLIIRGQDIEKPILLMLHGGPGSPEFPFMKDPLLVFEKEFVMVHWEQRGAGKSYNSDIPEESMTIDQFIADAAEISNYLRKKFKRDKIYLMGHSWGAFLGILTAQKHPDLFYSYTGIGQVTHQYLGERLSLEWAKEQAKIQNDQAGIAALNELVFPDSTAGSDVWWDYIIPERDYINKYGGGMKHESLNMASIYKMYIFDTPEYTIQDKIKLAQGGPFSLKHLWSDVLQNNLFQQIDSIQIPVHILQGVHDYQTPYAPAKAFFEQLKASKKSFHSFENSAHTPFLDEPEKFNAIIKQTVLGE